MSEPVARVALPAARLAADPPEEPPGLSSGFHGFRVVPHNRECVKNVRLNSGVAVRAWMMPPARCMRSMTGAFSVAIRPALTSDPSVRERPAMACFSFVATGMPSSVRCVPVAKRSSALRACSRASSKIRSVKALTTGSVFSACSMTARISSTGDSSCVAKSRRASVALRYGRSEVMYLR
jgi:hypothetical protein